MLPWQKIAVMLSCAGYDLISRLKKASKGISQKIKAFRCISCENDLLSLPGMNEIRNSLPGFLISLGRLHGKIIKPPERVGILIDIELLHSLKHRQRSLRCCRIICIYKIRILKKRKILTYVFYTARHVIFPLYLFSTS